MPQCPGSPEPARLFRTWPDISPDLDGGCGNPEFRQLTHTPRDHSEPLCSRDGKLIYFVSDRDAERSRNSYGGYHSNDREVWAYDRQTGQERFLWRTSRDLGLDLEGVTANGGLLISAGSELRTLAQNPLVADNWVINNVDEAAVSSDGRRLALVIAESYGKYGRSQKNAKLFVADAATGRSRTEVGQYERPKWSPDGTRVAAFFDGGLAILSATTHQAIERVRLPKRDAPADDMSGRLMARTCWPVFMVRMAALEIRKATTSF